MKKNVGFFAAKSPSIKEFLAANEKPNFSHIKGRHTFRK
jgi:hypothetical protein